MEADGQVFILICEKKYILKNGPGVYFHFSSTELKFLKKEIDKTLKYYKKNNLTDKILSRIDSSNLVDYIENGPYSSKNREESVTPLKDLYLIGNKSKTKLKIGISRDCKRRLKDLEGSSGENLEILFTCKNKSNLEKILHKEFESLQIGREWFKYSEEIINRFRSIS